MALHERFRDYTLKEIIAIKKEVCIAHKCPYLARMSDYQNASAVSNNFCSYIDKTGRMRECMPDECTHYNEELPKEKKKHRR